MQSDCPILSENAFRHRGVHQPSGAFARCNVNADTHPQFHPALLRLPAMVSQAFTRDLVKRCSAKNSFGSIAAFTWSPLLARRKRRFSRSVDRRVVDPK